MISARRRRRGWRRGNPGPTTVVVVVMVVASVVRTMSGKAGSGQGEGGEDRHEDFLVVVRFITSSLSAHVGLTLREATGKAIPDTENKKQSSWGPLAPRQVNSYWRIFLQGPSRSERLPGDRATDFRPVPCVGDMEDVGAMNQCVELPKDCPWVSWGLIILQRCCLDTVNNDTAFSSEKIPNRPLPHFSVRSSPERT